MNNQYNCEFCHNGIQTTLVQLNCGHTLCTQCSEFLKIFEFEVISQNKLKLICPNPGCMQTTRTEKIFCLQIQLKNPDILLENEAVNEKRGIKYNYPVKSEIVTVTQPNYEGLLEKVYDSPKLSPRRTQVTSKKGSILKNSNAQSSLMLSKVQISQQEQHSPKFNKNQQQASDYSRIQKDDDWISLFNPESKQILHVLQQQQSESLIPLIKAAQILQKENENFLLELKNNQEKTELGLHEVDDMKQKLHDSYQEQLQLTNDEFKVLEEQLLNRKKTVQENLFIHYQQQKEMLNQIFEQLQNVKKSLSYYEAQNHLKKSMVYEESPNFVVNNVVEINSILLNLTNFQNQNLQQKIHFPKQDFANRHKIERELQTVGSFLYNEDLCQDQEFECVSNNENINYRKMMSPSTSKTIKISQATNEKQKPFQKDILTQPSHFFLKTLSKQVNSLQKEQKTIN